MINEGIVNVSYIIATILFILALGGLSNQETARRGNWYGIIGMTIALLATVFGGDVTACLLYTSPSPRDQRGSRMPSSA